MSSDKKFFLAARRDIADNGTNLVLVDPWTGERRLMPESPLRDIYSIELGDFVHANVDPMGILYNISKTNHTARLWTKVEGNVALVENVLSELKEIHGEFIFQNKLFGDSVCKDKTFPLGEYKIKINLLETPLKLSNGRTIHFEATNPEPKPQKNITGAGFPVPAKRSTLTVGEGFQMIRANNEPVERRAVVLSRVEKPIGTHYYLWVIDTRVESLFVSKNHDLQLGHFFAGNFIEKSKSRITCETYLRPISSLFSGGISSNGKIYFTVPIDQFKPATSDKPACAYSIHFGEVWEGDTEKTKLSSNCNGKLVNIQRRGVGGKIFVWKITEIL